MKPKSFWLHYSREQRRCRGFYKKIKKHGKTAQRQHDDTAFGEKMLYVFVVTPLRSTAQHGAVRRYSLQHGTAPRSAARHRSI
jgi:hypothetical protein